MKFAHTATDYQPDEGKMPTVSALQASLLRLVTDLRLSNNQARAVCLWHNAHLGEEAPVDVRGLRSKVDRYTQPPLHATRRIATYTVPPSLGIGEGKTISVGDMHLNGWITIVQ